MTDNSINPKDRLGAAKPPLHLVPPALVLWVSRIFGFSSVKYGPFNWRDKAVRLTVYIDAIERHLLAMKDGQDIDSESGLPHAAHIGANCAILLDAKATGNLIDDRKWKPGAAAQLIAELTEKSETTKPQAPIVPSCGRADCLEPTHQRTDTVATPAPVRIDVGDGSGYRPITVPAAIPPKPAPKEWRCKHCGESIKRVWSDQSRKNEWKHANEYWGCGKHAELSTVAELAE